MKNKKIKSVLILGGGTAGWIMAISLIKHCPKLRIILIESEEIKNVGVGESTIPGVRWFINDYLDFDEKEWMPLCDATYKSVIRFNNFKNLQDRDTLYHPFWTTKEYNIPGFEWMAKKVFYPNTLIRNYYSTHYLSYHMSKNLKFDTLTKEEGFEYAYHLDADKFQTICKNRCIRNKLNYIKGTIDKVSLDKEGNIEKVSLIEDGKELSADFFIDCTGFSAKLIDKTLKDPFINLNEYLLNDRAIVTHLPYKDKKVEMVPYTNCTALSSGWVWNIPLWSRISTGYVYSSKFLSSREAEKEFRDYLGKKRIKGLEFRHINMRVGRQANPWKSNCLSVGLAAGFLEPLESTGLGLLVGQIRSFIQLLKDNDYNYDEFEIASYNRKITSAYDDIFNFILAHFIFTNRVDTPYWKYINKHNPVSYKLQKIIKEIDDKGFKLVNEDAVFRYKSWENIIIGFKDSFWINKSDSKRTTLLDNLHKKFTYNSKNDSLQVLMDLMEKRRKALILQTSKMKNHYQYLKDNIYNLK